MIRILVAEDEKAIAEFICSSLTEAGFSCTVAYDGAAASDLIEEQDYDLALLDIMLPEVNGYELLEYLSPLGVPVIFITAKSAVSDRVKGLKLGADDYIVKPFEFEELIARIESVLRRCGRAQNGLEFRDITVNETERIVRNGDRVVDLSPTEFDLLVLLMQNKGKTVFREYLYERIWGDCDEMNFRNLNTYIRRLRRQLSLDGHIKSVYGVGYRLEDC